MGRGVFLSLHGQARTFMVLWKNHFRSQDNEHLSFWNVTFHKLLWTLKLFDAYIVKSFKYLFIWLCQVFSCGMWDLFIVTWSGIKSRPPALGAWSLSHWAPRRVPINYCFHVCREHALRIINLLSSLGMWGSCHHCFYLGSCLVLLLHGFVATKICAFFFLICFPLYWALGAAHRLSLVAASGDYSLVAVLRLLTALASLVAEHRL